MGKVAHTLNQTWKFAAHPLNIFPSETALKQNVVLTLAEKNKNGKKKMNNRHKHWFWIPQIAIHVYSQLMQLRCRGQLTKNVLF